MKVSEIFTQVTIGILVNLKCYTSAKIVPLMFNQYQCDSTTHLVTEKTSYQIFWFGELLPYMCTISFSVEDNYELCYNSEYFFMPRRLGDVKLKIENSTFVKTYGRSSKKVMTKCIENAYNMTFTLAIKNGPASNDLGQYIKLKIVAKEQKEDEGEHGFNGYAIGACVVAVIFLTLVLHGHCKKDNNFENFKTSCAGFICGITNKTLKSAKSCCNKMGDCRCCLKLGDCCIAIGTKWKTCVKTNNEQDNAIEPRLSSISTSPPTIPEVNTSPVIIEETLAPPPEYDESWITSSNPSSPPPSYDEVVHDRY